jgi:hypothetical protein
LFNEANCGGKKNKEGEEEKNTWMGAKIRNNSINDMKSRR